MNWQSDFGVVWQAQDTFAEELLRQMGEFAQLSRGTAPGTALVRSVSRAKLLELIGSTDYLECYGAFWRQISGGTYEITVEATDFSSDLPLHVTRLRQIFYLGFFARMGKRLLPYHGALAEYQGRGFLFAGRSGMGKSTTMRRLPASWRILADDAVLLEREQEQIFARPLPTWSCGYNGDSPIFCAGGRVPLDVVIELSRGKPELIPLQGLEKYGTLLCGFHDGLEQFNFGMPGTIRKQLRSEALNFSVEMTKTLHFYRLPLTLMDEFAYLLEQKI